MKTTKPNMTKSHFLNLTINPEHILCELTKEDFRLARKVFGYRLICYDCGDPVTPPTTVMNGRVQIGTGECLCNRQFENNEPAFKYHLKQLILSPDPYSYVLDYLEEGGEK